MNKQEEQYRQQERFAKYEYDQIVSFDNSPRESLPAGQLVNQVVVQGLTLHTDDYRLEPAIVKGHRSVRLLARTPDESDRPSEYRPILHGRKALAAALALFKCETLGNQVFIDPRTGDPDGTETRPYSPWTLEGEKRVHEFFTEEGGHEPDHGQGIPDIWALDY